jgi:voltage-gated sodium channel
MPPPIVRAAASSRELPQHRNDDVFPDPIVSGEVLKTAAREEDGSDPLLNEYLQKLEARLIAPVTGLHTLFDEDEGTSGDEVNKRAKWRQDLARMTHANWFQFIIATAVILNAIQMGVQCDLYGEPYDKVYAVLEIVFTVLFLFEMVVKLVAFGCSYFYSSWNIMDFFLCWLSVFDIFVVPFLLQSKKTGTKNFSVLRILRLLRVVRVARIFKFLKELWLILRGIMESFRTLVWVTLLLGVVLYICAIFCTQMIGQSPAETYEDFPEGFSGSDFNKEQYFGSIFRSMVTLFNIVIMTGDWDIVCRAVVEKQAWMFIFFLAFIMLTTFGLMNVIIGVVVDNVISQAGECETDFVAAERLKRVELLKSLEKACFMFDTDGDGWISREEFAEALKNEEVRAHFDGISALPLGWEDDELFWMLNTNPDLKLTHHEFVLSMLRLIEHDPQQQLLLLLAVMHEVVFLLKTLRDGSVGGAADSKPRPTRVTDSKPISVHDRPGSPTQGGWDWCAQQVVRQGEQLDHLLRMLNVQQNGGTGGVGTAAQSQAPMRGPPTQSPVSTSDPAMGLGMRLPLPLGAYQNGGFVPGPADGRPEFQPANRSDAGVGPKPGPKDLSAPFSRDAAQVRSMFASLTPRRTSPVRQAVLRQVECLQDYAASVSNAGTPPGPPR